jgi:hypothetical protein
VRVWNKESFLRQERIWLLCKKIMKRWELRLPRGREKRKADVF